MKVIQMQLGNTVFTYKGITFRMENMLRNLFTNVWSFDLHWDTGSLLGVAITSGSNVLKGNGTPIDKMIFVDPYSEDGDITYPSNVKLYILED